jgi:hypothetical protein
VSTASSIDQTVHPDCREFAAVVEALLARRQLDLRRPAPAGGLWYQDGWGPRTWTRTELEDMVYSSYKQMRQGRITRPPRRDTVMEIADYLNCTLEERNRLLIAARATPVVPYLTGPRLDEALRVAQGVAETLVIPAAIINRDWRIHYINPYMLRLNGLTPAQLAAIPPDRLNMLRLLFDPQLPLYPHLSQNPESWTRMVRQTIYGFKQANLLCQFEPWYRELVLQLMGLPDFEAHWRTVSVDAGFDSDPSARAGAQVVTVETVLAGPPRPQRARLRPLLISVGYFQFDFPQILALLPADEESQALFRQLGLPAPDGS